MTDAPHVPFHAAMGALVTLREVKMPKPVRYTARVTTACYSVFVVVACYFYGVSYVVQSLPEMHGITKDVCDGFACYGRCYSNNGTNNYTTYARENDKATLGVGIAALIMGFLFHCWTALLPLCQEPGPTREQAIEAARQHQAAADVLHNYILQRNLATVLNAERNIARDAAATAASRAAATSESTDVESGPFVKA